MPEPWILVGGPVYKREWVLPDYFGAIERQDWPLDQIGFIFECAPNDPETVQVLVDYSHQHPELKCFDISINTEDSHVAHPEGFRTWTRERYTIMAKMRNKLLTRVMVHDPDRYFSLDSDILLENPATLTELFQLTETLDAVSPLTFMTPTDINFPSTMTWLPDFRGAIRPLYPLGTLFKSDVIMAAKMMSKKVYQTARYNFHHQGEDLGWSMSCRSLGYSLWCASHLYASHVMSRAALATYHTQGDPRKLLLESFRSENT